MGWTLQSHLSLQKRIILLEDIGWSQTTLSMEHRTLEEVLSIRNPKKFQFSHFVECNFVLVTDLQAIAFPSLPSINSEEQHYSEVIIFIILKKRVYYGTVIDT